jgi:hypothetical protein
MRIELASFVVLITAACVGCAMPRTEAPVTQTVNVSDVRGRLTYQRTIADRPVCSNDDAFHLLIQYVNKTDPCETYQERVDWLRSRQMLPADFDRPADEASSRGNLAVAISRALRVRGGVMFSLLPTSGRYATRELVARGIYPPGSSPHQTYSGLELLGVLAKMEDVQAGDPSNIPASELGTTEEAQP